MRKLLLLRHAKSDRDDPGLADFDRPLAGRGRRDAARMGRFLAGAGIRPGRVLVSAAIRTRATLDLFAPALEGVPVSIEEDFYEADRSALVRRLRRLEDTLSSVMVIGHNPGLERLAGFLSGGHGEEVALERMSQKFPTCALAVLACGAPSWKALDGGSCRLEMFVRPSDLPE